MTLDSVVRRVPAVLASVAIVATSAGCYTMARVPAGYVTTQKPAEIFVRDADGAVYSLSNPTIVHDSLMGHDGVEQLSVHLREVDAMVVRAISPARTAGAIGAGAALLGVVAFGVVKAATGNSCAFYARDPARCKEFVDTCKYSCEATPDP